jgi:hypothetical protein
MPELLKPLHQVPLETVGVDAIEVVSAKIFAVAHTIIVIGYHLQKNQSNYVW